MDESQTITPAERKIIRKRNQEHKKKANAVRKRMFDHVRRIPLYIEPDNPDLETWRQVASVRERVLQVSTSPAHFVYAITNWRLIELQIILLMHSKEWMAVQTVSCSNLPLLVEFHETAYSLRIELAELYKDGTAARVPKAQTPDEYVTNIPTELALICNMTASEDPIKLTLSFLHKWFDCMSIMISCILQFSAFNRIVISVPHAPVDSDREHFADVNMLLFVTFAETDDFPKLLEDWNCRNSEHFGREATDGNVEEVRKFMEDRWILALARLVDEK